MLNTYLYTGRITQTQPVAMSLIKNAFRTGRQCYVIVPEQYTLQMERDLLKTLAVPGFFTLQVLSPSRLYYRIFEQAGQDARTPIDFIGQQIAIRQALLKASRHLTYYQKIADTPGFSDKILQEILRWKEAGRDTAFLLDQLAQQKQSFSLQEKF